MADHSNPKGKHSSGRRSSILKRALADIDLNVKDKNPTTLRSSKRVSFAETYVVKEFLRDSPQFLKDDDKCIDPGIILAANQDKRHSGTSNPSWLDGGDFDLDIGETTFINELGFPDDIPHESTCIANNSFLTASSNETKDRLQVLDSTQMHSSEVTNLTLNEDNVFDQQENIVSSHFSDHPKEKSINYVQQENVVASHFSNCPKEKYNDYVQQGNIVANHFSNLTIEKNKIKTFHASSETHIQHKDTYSVQPTLLKGADKNQTILFDMQDGEDMDLTQMEKSCQDVMGAEPESPPKLCAREFLSKLKGQHKSTAQVREERSVFFTDLEPGNTMELTCNIPEPGFISVAPTIDAVTEIAQLHTPSKSVLASLSIENTILFSSQQSGNDMSIITSDLDNPTKDTDSVGNLTNSDLDNPTKDTDIIGNLSLNYCQAPHLSAKSFLDSLRSAPALKQPELLAKRGITTSSTSISGSLLPSEDAVSCVVQAPLLSAKSFLNFFRSVQQDSAASNVAKNEADSPSISDSLGIAQDISSSAKAFLASNNSIPAVPRVEEGDVSGISVLIDPQNAITSPSTISPDIHCLPKYAKYESQQCQLEISLRTKTEHKHSQSAGLLNQSDTLETMELTECEDSTRNVLEYNGNMQSSGNSQLVRKEDNWRNALADITVKMTSQASHTVPESVSFLSAAAAPLHTNNIVPTVENDSLTLPENCRLHSLPLQQHYAEKSVSVSGYINKKESGPCMHLKNTNPFTSVENPILNEKKKVVFSAEKTRAGVTLACLDSDSSTQPVCLSQLSKSRHLVIDTPEKTVSTKDTEAGMHLSCQELNSTAQSFFLPPSSKNQQLVLDMPEKTVIFKADDSEADMSCTSLASNRDRGSIRCSVCSPHAAMIQQSFYVPEKTKVFSTDNTEVDMNLTEDMLTTQNMDFELQKNPSCIFLTEKSSPPATHGTEKVFIVSTDETKGTGLSRDTAPGNTAAITCSDAKFSSFHADKCERENTLIFNTEETDADMSLTTIMSSEANIANVSVCPEQKTNSANTVTNPLVVSLKAENTLFFSTDVTCEEMSLTHVPINSSITSEALCKVSQSFSLPRQQNVDKTLLFNTDETVADMSLIRVPINSSITSEALCQVPQSFSLPQQQDVDKTLVFNTIETVADMSLTRVPVSSSITSEALCQVSQSFSLPQQQDVDKTLLFNTDETMADMSLTHVPINSSITSEALCQVPQSFSLPQQKNIDKTLFFKTDETVADMSLTHVPINSSITSEALCQVSQSFSLPTKKNIDKTLLFNTDETVADMSLTHVPINSSITSEALCQVSQSFSVPRQKNVDKTLLFNSSKADMSLTSVPLHSSFKLDPFFSEPQPCSQTRNKNTDRTLLLNTAQSYADMMVTKFTAVSESLCQVSQPFSPPTHNNMDKTLLFNTDETKANMSSTHENSTITSELPCQDSQLFSLQKQKNTEQTLFSNTDKVKEDMSSICLPTNLIINQELLCQDCHPFSLQKHKNVEKTLLFNTDETKADLSLMHLLTNSMYNPKSTFEKLEGENVPCNIQQLENTTSIFTADDAAAPVTRTVALSSLPGSLGSEETNNSSKNNIEHVIKDVSSTNKEDELDLPDSTEIVKSNDRESQETEQIGSIVPGTRGLAEAKRLFNQLNSVSSYDGDAFESLGAASGTIALAIQEEKLQLKCFRDVQTEKADCKVSAKIGGESNFLCSRGPHSAPKTCHQSDIKLVCECEPPTLSMDANVTVSENLKRKLYGFQPVLPGSMAKIARLESKPFLDVQGSASNQTGIQERVEQRRVIAEAKQYLFRSSLNMALASSASSSFLPNGTSAACDNTLARVWMSHKNGTVAGNSSVSGPEKFENDATSLDILAETMPALPSQLSPMPDSAVSSSSMNPLSLSASNINTTSSISLGKSFAERKLESDQPCDFETFLNLMEIEMLEMKAPDARRSGGFIRPELSCATLEDKLKAILVKQELKIKTEAFSLLSSVVEVEVARSGELEAQVTSRLAELMGIARRMNASSQLSEMQKGVRTLLVFGKKKAQASWKRHKADMLQQEALALKERQLLVSAQMEDVLQHINTNLALTERLKQGISKMQTQHEERKETASLHHHLQEKLQRKRTDLDSLKQKLMKEKSIKEIMLGRICELEKKHKEAKAHRERSTDLKQQIVHEKNILYTLHRLHSWQPTLIGERQIELLLLFNAVLMTVEFNGPFQSHLSIGNITATSRLAAEDSRPWAVLATRLLVEKISISSASLITTYPSRQHLPQLLDEISKMVEDARALSQELKFASLRYLLTVHRSKVEAELWSLPKLRKVVLDADFQNYSYPVQPLSWRTKVIMGDISESQVQSVVTSIDSGIGQFTRVLEVVQELLES